MTPSRFITAIEQHSRQVEERLHHAERVLNNAIEQEVRLEHQIASHLGEIASLQLEHDPTQDQDAYHQLQQREQAQALLRGDREQVEQRIASNLEQQSTVSLRIEALQTQAMAQLQQDPAFVTLCEQLDAARQEAEDTQATYQEIRDECATKLPAYASNPIYRFLKFRHYGTEHYRPYRFQRGLDDFLARKVGFRANQANEQILLAMQARIDVQQRAQACALAMLEQQYQQRQRQAREAIGMEPLQAELKRLQGLTTDFKAQANALHGQLDVYARREDTQMRAIREKLAQRLKSRPLADLLEAAARTPDNRDDALVAELKVLRPRLHQAQLTVEQLQREHNVARHAYDRAKEGERALRDQARGISEYRFLQPIEQTLARYMHGEIDLSMLEGLVEISRVEIGQRSSVVSGIGYLLPSSGGSSSSGSSGFSSRRSSAAGFSSSSSSGGGGFSSSSSSGGGGFRTTDSF